MASMSSLNLKHFLFLLVLLASCALCSSHNGTDDQFRAPTTPRPPPPPPAPKYDYFILSLQWPNGLCSQAYVTCRPSPPTQQYFTVHGLWPQNNQGPPPEYCAATPVTDKILMDLKDDLMAYWPRLYSAKNFVYSKTLWTEQWSKHGSCSSNKFPPKEYFERGIALGKEYGKKILEYLEVGDVIPDGITKYSYTKISKAITQGMKKEVKVIITCNNDKNGNLQLFDIRLCFNADAKTLENCTKGSSTCNGGFIFASERPPSPPPSPPPRRYPPTDNPSLGLTSFKLDVEEIAEF